MRLSYCMVLLLLASSFVSAFSDPLPLVRVWGLIENETGDSPNCNLLDSLSIEANGEDVTYTSAVGFYEGKCYYSLDIDASLLEEDDILKVIIQGVASEPFTYTGGDIVNEESVVNLPSEYFSFITGCMDASADNYDSSVNYDDGSCEYGGCTDEDAYNYNPNANSDDGSCMYTGCMDSEALNYDENADINVGCEYLEEPKADENDSVVYGCVEETATNYDSLATDDDGSCVFEETEEEQEAKPQQTTSNDNDNVNDRRSSSSSSSSRSSTPLPVVEEEITVPEQPAPAEQEKHVEQKTKTIEPQQQETIKEEGWVDKLPAPMLALIFANVLVVGLIVVLIVSALKKR